MLIRILKRINSLPVRLTIRHFESFGQHSVSLKDGRLDSPEAWDVLRRDHSHFSISKDRDEWLRVNEGSEKKDGQDGMLLRRAMDVSNLIQGSGFRTVFSVGAGGAGLEYHIKKMHPEIRLVCSEYAPENVQMLKGVFREADDVVEFDMKRSEWSSTQNIGGGRTLILMYRVDPHASDREWREIFERMKSSGVSDVLYIPSTALTMLSMIKRKIHKYQLKKRDKSNLVFCGYLRTAKTFESFWEVLYDSEKIRIGDQVSYYLH